MRSCDIRLLKIVLAKLVMNLLERSYGLSVVSVSRLRVHKKPVGVGVLIDGFSCGEFLMQRQSNRVFSDIEKTANLVSVDLQVLEFIQANILLF